MGVMVKLQRVISLGLVVLAVVMCLVMVGAALDAPRRENKLALIWLAESALVLACSLAVAILAIVIARQGVQSLRSGRAIPRLLTALSSVLGVLTIVLLTMAGLVLYGTVGAHDRLIGLGYAAAGMVNAAVMVITVSFRALLEKFRKADFELSRVI